MPEEITKEVFEKLVSLASLELEEEEAEYLRGQLNNQLRSIHELETIPISDDVPPARHGVPFPPEISPGLRQDVTQRFLAADEILSQAPQIEENYIVVPDIPHTRLE